MAIPVGALVWFDGEVLSQLDLFELFWVDGGPIHNRWAVWIDTYYPSTVRGLASRSLVLLRVELLVWWNLIWTWLSYYTLELLTLLRLKLDGIGILSHQCSMESIWSHWLTHKTALDVWMLDSHWTPTSTTSDSWILTPYLLMDMLSIDGMMGIRCCVHWLFIFIVVNWTSFSVVDEEVWLSVVVGGRLYSSMNIFTILFLIGKGCCLLWVLPHFAIRQSSELVLSWLTISIMYFRIISRLPPHWLSIGRNCILALVSLYVLCLHLHLLQLLV